MSKSSRLLAALITGLSAGFFMPAFSEEVTYCANVGHYCRSTVNSDCCGADLSSPTVGANLASDGVDGSVTSNRAVGTIDGCIYTGSTAPTKAQIEAGSAPCLNTKAVSSPAAGVNSFTSSNRFDSLASSTEYRAAYVHDDGTNRPLFEVITSAPFTTLAGGGSGGSDLTGMAYVVDSVNGNDSNTGLSVAQAWKTLAKVANNVTASGSDVCLMDDSEWTGEQLVLDWGGSSQDRGRVMGCYVDAGDSNRLVEYDLGTGVGRGAKPTINGSLTQSCIDNNNCNWTSDYGGCSNGFDGQVRIDTSHHELKHVSVQYTKCSAVKISPSGVSGYQVGQLTDFLVENIEARYSGIAWMVMQNGVQDGVVRESIFEFGNRCEISQSNGGTTGLTPTCGGGGWPGGVVVTRSGEAGVLIEDNEIRWNFGEGINIFQAGGVIVRRNLVANTHSNHIYLDGSRGGMSVIEENILLGAVNNDIGEGEGTHFTWFGRLAANVEDNTRTGNGYHGVFRNNALVNTGDCYEATMQTNAGAEGEPAIYKAFGNVCISPEDRSLDVWNGLSSNNIASGAVRFESNVFWSTDNENSDRCRAEVENDYNVHASATVAACSGGNDVSGVPVLGETYANFSLMRAGNEPSIDDFRLQAGSPGIGAGNPGLETEVCVTESYFDGILSEMSAGYTPDPTHWKKCLYYDYEGTARDASAPDAGMLEYAP